VSTTVSIGILAHNEAKRLPHTLESLWTQSVFSDPAFRGSRVEVVCVPNGCTDGTEEVVDRHFREAEGRLTVNPPRLINRPVDRAGKINAWNRFVHDIGDQGADFVVLMDADIEFGSPDTIARLIESLRDHPEAHASVDVPVKDIERDGGGGLIGMLSRGNSGITRGIPGQLCGQLYCVRGPTARRIELPKGLIFEDGFIGALLITDFFTREPDPARIVCAPDVCHYFKAYLGFKEMLRYGRRQAAGHAVSGVLFTYLWGHCSPSSDAADVLRSNNRSDPDWFEKLLSKAIDEGKVSAREWGAVTTRVKYVLSLPFPKAIRLMPSAVAASIYWYAAGLSADRYLRSNRNALPW
jgi:glycosyltransferase involved in cell wall biosynthesis